MSACRWLWWPCRPGPCPSFCPGICSAVLGGVLPLPRRLPKLRPLLLSRYENKDYSMKGLCLTHQKILAMHACARISARSTSAACAEGWTVSEASSGSQHIVCLLPAKTCYGVPRIGVCYAVCRCPCSACLLHPLDNTQSLPTSPLCQRMTPQPTTAARRRSRCHFLQ
jgi:hypothetical protein